MVNNILILTFKLILTMIFHFKAAQNLVAEHYERDFDTIFHFMVAQNVVAEQYERFWYDFPL